MLISHYSLWWHADIAVIEAMCAPKATARGGKSAYVRVCACATAERNEKSDSFGAKNGHANDVTCNIISPFVHFLPFQIQSQWLKFTFCRCRCCCFLCCSGYCCCGWCCHCHANALKFPMKFKYHLSRRVITTLRLHHISTLNRKTLLVFYYTEHCSEMSRRRLREPHCLHTSTHDVMSSCTLCVCTWMWIKWCVMHL